MGRGKMSVRKWMGSAACVAATMGLAVLPAGCSGRNGGGHEMQKLAADMPTPVSVQVEGIGNAKKLGSDLLFGGQPTEEALRVLAGQGYHTIVNLRGATEMDWNEQELVESLGMKYVAIPMAYPIEEINDRWVDGFDTVMSAPDSRPMLVHCSSGNRVGGLYGVWLAERKDVEHSRALDLAAAAGMTRLRPAVEKRLAAD
jgi:protein tyrosine phosphatase (PTP) superfamily phosphohydrolase (DUF442 family)